MAATDDFFKRPSRRERRASLNKHTAFGTTRHRTARNQPQAPWISPRARQARLTIDTHSTRLTLLLFCFCFFFSILISHHSCHHRERGYSVVQRSHALHISTRLLRPPTISMKKRLRRNFTRCKTLFLSKMDFCCEMSLESHHSSS